MNKNAIVIAFLMFSLSSCSLLKPNGWNAYKVTLEVRDAKGATIHGAGIRSSAKNEPKTDSNGRVSLYYIQRGLHVVTVQSAKMKTTQIKIRVPDDADKIVSLYMQPR